jgi:hydroxyacylglutathione hydrolase
LIKVSGEIFIMTKIRSFQAGQSVAHLIETASSLILVDAGSPGKEDQILREIKKMGEKELKLIFITHAHFDHYGSAAAVRRLTGAPIAIHEKDVDFMARGETPLGTVRGRGKIAKVFLPLAERIYRIQPTLADIVFSEGHQFVEAGAEIVAIHLPGHTPGSSGLLIDGRILFAGDLLSTTGKPHAQRYYATDWSQINTSLECIKSLELEWIYTGHGQRPLSGQALERLAGPED